MEKKEITEIMDMSFARFLEIDGGRYYHLSLNYINGMLGKIGRSKRFEDVECNSPIRDYLRHPLNDWENVRGFGKKTVNLIIILLERYGLTLGMTKAEIAALENGEQVTCDEDGSSTLTVQEYINTLKEFADKAGACTVGNEVYTNDGYKITIKVEKVKQ